MEKKKIKIIHIIPTLDMGGAERLMVDIALGLDRKIFESEVVCISSGGFWQKELEEADIPLTILNKKKGFSLRALLKLKKILKEKQPDIVHTHLFGADFYGRLAAKLANIKVIISTEHNLNISEGFFRKTAKKITNKFATRIIAVSEAVRAYAIQKEGADESKVKVIYNGIRLEKFLNEKGDYALGKTFKIGSIGRLSKQKGYEYLIEAINKLNDRKIVCQIASDGELKEQLNEKIALLGLGRQIELVGYKKNTPEFLNSLDLFVLSSRWEGLGIVILEAGAAGLPVIASDVDGIKEIIDDKEDGLLFTKGNSDELKEKIKYLLNNESERKRLGQALQRKIIEKFDIEKIVRQYEEVYIQACKNI